MPSETPPAPKKTSRWKLVLNVGILVVILGIFAREIWKNWQHIADYDWQGVRLEMAVAALLLLLVCYGIDVLIWNRTLRWFTDDLPYRLAAPVYLWSSLARYIPGKVASLVIRVALAREVKRDPIPVLAASTVELALRTASAGLLFLFSLAYWGFGFAEVGRNGTVLLGILVPIVLICAHPKLMLPIINWGLRKIKQPAVTKPLRYREVLGLFAALLVRWVLFGVAFATAALAVYPGTSAHIPVLMGTAGGSWAAGFVGMSPGGLGIQELVQRGVLASIAFPRALIDVFPWLFRSATLIAEGTWALVCLALHRSWPRAHTPTEPAPPVTP